MNFKTKTIIPLAIIASSLLIGGEQLKETNSSIKEINASSIESNITEQFYEEKTQDGKPIEEAMKDDIKKEDMVSFMENTIFDKYDLRIEGYSLIEKRKIPTEKNWEIAFFMFKVKKGEKEMIIPKILFINDNFISETLYNRETMESYIDTMKPEFKKEWYEDLTPIFGNKNAKHKIVVFSDPMCPYCKKTIPKLIKAAKMFPNKIALFYFSKPITRLHKQAKDISMIIYDQIKKGDNESILSIYTMPKGAENTKNIDELIDFVKTHTKIQGINKKEIFSEEIKDRMKTDEKYVKMLFATTSPTIFVDGNYTYEQYPLKKILTKKEYEKIKDKKKKKKIKKGKNKNVWAD